MDHQFDKCGKWDPVGDLVVPFEPYCFHASVFAIDPLTNTSVEIGMFGILDTPNDYVISFHNAAGTTDFTYESEDGLVTTEADSRVLWAEIKRSSIAKAFAICLFLGSWTVTIGSVYTTALVTFGRLEANSVVAALPLSALLAIPAIRSLYISSPPLGSSVGKPYLCGFPHPFRGLIHSTRGS